MKKWLTRLVVVGLLILDWLALDDITTGDEPNFVGEWLVIWLSLIVFGWLIWHKKKQ